MRRCRFRALLIVGLAGGALTASTSLATAATTIGLVDPTPGASGTCSGPQDSLNPTVTSGAGYVVPSLPTTDERITSWSTNAWSGANQSFTMKVFRFVGGTPSMPIWKVVGHDGPRPLVPNTLNTFSSISIPVQPGDVVGINSGPASGGATDCIFNVPGEPLLHGPYPGDIGDGMYGTFTQAANYLVNVSAVVDVSGQRAAALAKCKKKHSHRKRRKCKKKANRLPV